MKKKLYTVTVEVPTTYELVIEAANAEDAWDIAQNELDGKGLDHEVVSVVKK